MCLHVGIIEETRRKAVTNRTDIAGSCELPNLSVENHTLVPLKSSKHF